MNTDGEKRPNFSRLVDAQGSRCLGPKYRLSKRVYSARAGQLLTAAYLFAPNSSSIAKLVRNAGSARSAAITHAALLPRKRPRPEHLLGSGPSGQCRRLRSARVVYGGSQP